MQNDETGALALSRINFHHLYYFWAVAKSENLTRTARQLRVSQSALSSQIRQLEEQLGQRLFVREGRGLKLSESGRIAASYAQDIFARGHELAVTLREGRKRERFLRVGAVATLSRNFQESFVRPILAEPGVTLQLRSGTQADLLDRLARHELDVVLSNRPPPRGADPAWHARRLARQPVSLVGHVRRRAFRFPQSLRDLALIVPGGDSDLGSELFAIATRAGIELRVLAEVDDMATIRVLARAADAIALVPSVVVRDELRSRALHEYCVVPDLVESFYAITVDRHYPHPLVRSLLARDATELLGMPARSRRSTTKRARRARSIVRSK